MKKGFTKVVARSLALVLALGLVIGGLATIGPAAADEAVEQRTVRTAWFGSVARHEKFNKLMDMFEAAHPGITVEREYGAMGEYLDKLNTQLAGGNAPDVIQLTPLELTKYASRDVLMDLAPYVDKGAISLDGWDPKVMEIGSYNGVLHMLSIGMSSPALIINTSMLERLGVEKPPYEMTWDQFSAFAKDVQSKLEPNQWSLFDPGGNIDFLVISFLPKGKVICTPEETGLGFDASDVEFYLSFYDDLRKEGALPPPDVMSERGGAGWDDSMLVKNEVVMQMTNTNQLKIFQQYMEDTVEVFRLPTTEGVDQFGEIFTGVFLAMPNGCANPDDGATLIDWWCNDIEANRVYDMEHGYLGASKVIEALSDSISKENQKMIEHANSVITTAFSTTYRPINYGAIATALGDANGEVVFGMKTVEQAAADCIVKMEEALTAK